MYPFVAKMCYLWVATCQNIQSLDSSLPRCPILRQRNCLIPYFWWGTSANIPKKKQTCCTVCSRMGVWYVRLHHLGWSIIMHIHNMYLCDYYNYATGLLEVYHESRWSRFNDSQSYRIDNLGIIPPIKNESKYTTAVIFYLFLKCFFTWIFYIAHCFMFTQ